MDITAAWEWPQWTVAILATLNIVAAAALHDEPKRPSKHSFPIQLVSAAISTIILVCGGFYS